MLRRRVLLPCLFAVISITQCLLASASQAVGGPDAVLDPVINRVELQGLIDQAARQAADGNKAGVTQGNAAITALWSRSPDWVEARLTQISGVSEEHTFAVEMLTAMAADAQNAFQSGDFDTALSSQHASVAMAGGSVGAGHWLSVVANRELGLMYRQGGMGQEAESFYTAALDEAIDGLGEKHPEVMIITGLMAELYGALGLTEEAWLMQEAATQGLMASLGQGHPLTVNMRYEGISWLEGVGDYQAAVVASQALCVDIGTAYGGYHSETIDCLTYQAGSEMAMGQLAEAEATYDVVIERMASVMSGIDGQVFNVMADVAELYRQQGRYKESQDLLSGIIQTALEAGNLEAAYKAKAYLGRTMKEQGALEQARTLTEEVLTFGLQRWTDNPVSIYNTLLELGAILQAQGRLAEAQATFEEAFEGLTQDYGELHPSTLVAGVNLSQIYEKNGLYDKAEPLLSATLGRLEANFGPDHPDTLRARNNMALLHESQGNFREAEPLYLQSLGVLATNFGPDYTDTVAVKNNLAYLYMLMEDYDQASGLFADVQRQWLGLFGAEHQNTLKATNNLGRVMHKLDRLPEAEVQIKEALRVRRLVLGAKHLDSIRSMIDLGGVYIDQQRLPEAEQLLAETLDLAEAVLGNQHPYTFEALNMLARAREAANNLDEALSLREIGMERRSEFLDRMLWTTGENAREGYIRLHRPELNDYLALLARMDSPDGGKKLINVSLQRKGLLLKVTSEIQQIATLSRDPVLAVLADKLKATRKQLAALTLSGPTAETQQRHPQALYKLEQEVNRLQGELGRASVRFRTSIAQVSADTLETVLVEGRALVDFLVYEVSGERRMLAAVVVSEGGEFRYELIKYSDQEAIDRAIVDYRDVIQDELADEYELLEFGMDAYDLLWGPVQAALDGAKSVYLIPDGMLNILPFSALVNADEEYLIQTHDVHILSSGRDLLPTGFNLVEGEYVVLAGPDYDSQDVVSEAEMQKAMGKRSSAMQVGIRAAGTGLRGLSFAPLPGAELEGRNIVNQVDLKDVAQQEFFGTAAQEQVLSDLAKAPEILHMATHGFFLKAEQSLRKRLLKLQRGSEQHVPPPGDNPLLRAGLAFAGINTNAQFLGDIDTDNDGVLTALEVLSLNLSGTRLVVLSACETGLGEIHEGEGVYGLRRSFQEAGVAEVVSSLWEVSDAGTQALMTGFYDRLLTGQPAREALRDAKLALLDTPQWNYPYVWSAFMIVGSYESAGFTTP
jgi:CHAT domain-containing protein/lipopolysaccharide biosynthesis regulator YciM